MKKSQKTSFFLTLLFGPIGLFYSSVPAALGLLIAILPFIFTPILVFIAFLPIIWPVPIVVGYFAVKRHNLRVSIEDKRHNELLDAIRPKDNSLDNLAVWKRLSRASEV